MEAIACVKAIETGMLHPTLNQDDLEECVEGIDTCAGSKVEHEVTGAISNSFGFGAAATPEGGGIAARARCMLWGCDAAWRVASGIVGDRERHRSDSQTLEAARRAAEGGQPGRSF